LRQRIGEDLSMEQTVDSIFLILFVTEFSIILPQHLCPNSVQITHFHSWISAQDVPVTSLPLLMVYGCDVSTLCRQV